MKHKDKVMKLIKAFIFCILLLCLLRYTDKILERKASVQKLGAFFSQEKNIDVLFLGDSHMRNAVFPMELWNDHGITSYNLASGWSTHAVDYWILKNALDYVKPEVVVIDCTLISYEKRKVYSSSVMHEQIDEFPLTKNKINMINDLLDNWENRLSFFWKFSLYHSRWDELSESDFGDKELIIDKLNYGSKQSVRVSIPEIHTKLSKDDKLENDTLNMEYLRKTIDECQTRGIDVLLTYLPFPASEEKQREANTVYDIALEYNVDYVNFLDLDVVNYNTDCSDANSHLNVSGGRKISGFLGDYITKNYNITDHREDSDYISWNDNYKDYIEQNISMLKEQQDMDSYLMLLADKNLSCCIYIDESMSAQLDERLNELIENIPQYEIYYIYDGENIYLDGQYDAAVVVTDKHTGSIVDVSRFITYDNLHYGIREE